MEKSVKWKKLIKQKIQLNRKIGKMEKSVNGKISETEKSIKQEILVKWKNQF